MGLNITNNNAKLLQNSRVTSLCEECHVRGCPEMKSGPKSRNFLNNKATHSTVDRNAYIAGGQIPHQETVS
jgi:hypothetical protein